MVEMGEVYTEKCNGQSTDPWGHQYSTSWGGDECEPMRTHRVLPVKYDCVQECTLPAMPKL